VDFWPKSKMVNHTAHSYQKLPYKGLQVLDNLSYGCYYKDSLIWQLGSPKFDPYLKKLTFPAYDWFSVEGSQYLSIPLLKGGVMLAAKEEASLGYKISFFSLLFFVLVLSLVILSILNSIVAFLPDQMYLRFVKVTSLQNKLQYAFIGVLVFSFICIGVTSVYYFKQEYLKDNMLRLAEYVDTWRKSSSEGNPDIHLSPISSKRISPSSYFMTSTFEKSNINWPFPLFINTLPNFPGLPYSIYTINNSHNLQQIYPQVKDDQIISTYIASPNEDSWIGVYYSLEAPQSIRSG
jgi:hypothetical protein